MKLAEGKGRGGEGEGRGGKGRNNSERYMNEGDGESGYIRFA